MGLASSSACLSKQPRPSLIDCLSCFALLLAGDGDDAGVKQWNVYSSNIDVLRPKVREHDGNYDHQFHYGVMEKDTAPYDVSRLQQLFSAPCMRCQWQCRKR